jgi:hypothetical protein
MVADRLPEETRMNFRFATLAALALTVACGLAQAQSAAPQGSFRCGGVGQDEQQRFKADAPKHDALLTFAASTGAYLSDVDVRITDSRGKVVLEGRCGGPLMLVDLPGAGSYQVNAAFEGKSQRKTLAVGAGKPASATFTWAAAG